MTCQALPAFHYTRYEELGYSTSVERNSQCQTFLCATQELVTKGKVF